MARIDQVAGIGHREATKLRKAGIKTSKSLIEMAATGRGRSELTAATGIDQRLLQAIENAVLEEQVVDWVLENAKVTPKDMSFQDVIAGATQAGA